MFEKSQLMECLKCTCALTVAIQQFVPSDDHSNRWPWIDADELNALQNKNRGAFDLRSVLASSTEVDRDLRTRIWSFVLEECRDGGLADKKMALLSTMSNVTGDTEHISYIYEKLIESVTEPREVYVLVTDLYKYRAGKWSSYRTILFPVVERYAAKLNTYVFRPSDNIYAFAELAGGQEVLLELARDLRTAWRRGRVQMGFPATSAIAIGISRGTCVYNFAAGQLEATGKYFEAAELMYGAEELCRKDATAGGIIAVSRDLASVLQGKTELRKLKDRRGIERTIYICL